MYRYYGYESKQEMAIRNSLTDKIREAISEDEQVTELVDKTRSIIGQFERLASELGCEVVVAQTEHLKGGSRRAIKRIAKSILYDAVNEAFEEV